MFKIMKEEAPNYLMNLTQNVIKQKEQEIAIFQSSAVEQTPSSILFPFLRDWFNLDDNIGNSESISVFKNRLLLFIRPVQNSVFNIFDLKGLKPFIWLRLGFSRLNKHRFRHNFENCVNPLCSCSLEADDTLHYLLHCHHFNQHRLDLMNSVKSVLDNFKSLSDNTKKEILLYGDSRLDNNKNKFILEATLNNIKTSERFSGSLFE